MTPTASHGPISARLQAKLEENVVSKEALSQRLASGELKVLLRPAAAGDVTLPFHLVNDTPVVGVGINGHGKVPMQLDTGAARTMIGAGTAVANDVTMLRAEDASVDLKGVIGDEKGRVGILSPLQVGSWGLWGYPCVVRTHDNVMRVGFGRKRFSSDLLGFDLAARYAAFLTIDYPAKTVTYGFRERFPEPKGRGVGKAKLLMQGGVPFVTLKAGRHSWEALVDTGSFNGIELSSKVAGKLGLKDKGETVTGLYLMSVGGTVSSADAGLRAVILPALEIFGGSAKQAQATVSPGIPRVGSFFLKDYRVTFDFRRGLIWLER